MVLWCRLHGGEDDMIIWVAGYKAEETIASISSIASSKVLLWLFSAALPRSVTNAPCIIFWLPVLIGLPGDLSYCYPSSRRHCVTQHLFHD